MEESQSAPKAKPFEHDVSAQNVLDSQEFHIKNAQTILDSQSLIKRLKDKVRATDLSRQKNQLDT